jgi:hypothetical protein
MASKSRNLSALIDNQLPSFISNEYPKFSAFLQKYYEHLELDGNPLDIVNNLTKYRDVDTYDSSVSIQNTKLVQIITLPSEINIEVEDASSFPEKNGYIRINDEIIFYANRNQTTFINCYRNVSGTTKIGDLYEKSEFKYVSNDQVGIGSENYPTGTIVSNISNLFLYALVKNFESEYLRSFPEKALKKQINRSVLIKNIKDFYATKGTEQSIKFIFNSIVAEDSSDIPTVYYPKNSVYKSSTGEWINKYGLKVKIFSGDVSNIVGQRIVQRPENDKKYASAIVESVDDIGDGFYEIVLNPSSVVGEFSILAKTKLSKDFLPTDNYINVVSTSGWDSIGSILIDGETINFSSKNIRQFKIDTRSSNASYFSGTDVYENTTLSSVYLDQNGNVSNIDIFVFGVLYGLIPSEAYPYSKTDDKIQISSSTRESFDTVVYDSINQRVRWILNDNNQNPDSNSSVVTQGLSEVLNNVSAIFEDEEYFYIASSGYPQYKFGTVSWAQVLQDQKHLKLIRKKSTKTTEIYETNKSDVGIFVNGVTARGYKDSDENLVVFGEITNVTVTNQGSGYKNPPYVLIQDGAGEIVASASAIMNGEVVERIEIIDSGSGFFPPVPEITITSGRNAIVEPVVTRDRITSLKIIDPGEYYSSAPEVIIKDSKGSGRFARFDAIISNDGKIIGFNKLDEGKFYTQEFTSVEIRPVGSGAAATSVVRSWRKDLVKKHQNSLDNNYGYYFLNPDNSLGYGYSCLANPKDLRIALSDNLNSVGLIPQVLSHSPILGYAYDGNPIYGPYGYSNPVDKNSSISRMTSSYSLNYDRPLGPPLEQYPIGSFVEDYSYNHRLGSLDENNGRFCVTPEYPEGVYAYFITIDSNNIPVFPYILGKNYYSIPVDSNYTKAISQKDLSPKCRRLSVGNLYENGEGAVAYVDSISTGSVSSAVVESTPKNFKVGCSVETNYQTISDPRIDAKVSSVKGENVLSIEAKNSIKIISDNNAYFFNGDTITQSSTNATGELVGNVFDSKTIVLRNVIGTFNEIDGLSSTISVVNLLVNKSSSYTKGTSLILTNGKQQGLTRIISNKLYVGTNPFVNGEKITFSRSAYGITEGILYYVKNASSTNFEISLTSNGSTVVLTDSNSPGIIATSEEARGEVLETTQLSNTVKIKVLKGSFFSDDSYYLRSLSITDTIGSKIVTINSLSSGILPFSINNNIAIVKTDDQHKLAIGDKVNIDIKPNDATTETTYYVRSRIYQKLKLYDPFIQKTIKDTGIGSIVTLNNGSYDYNGEIIGDYAYSTNRNGTFTDVELIFADVTKCRDDQGIIVGNSNRAIIGRPGNPNNAKATISVTNGIVTNINITFKGIGYKQGDILSVSNDSLNRNPSSVNTRFLLVEVGHVGLGNTQTRIFLDDTNGISINDYFTIGEEIVKVTNINTPNYYIDVLRSQFNTVAKNHFNNELLTSYKSKYNLSVGFKLSNSSEDASVYSYDPETQELTLIYDLGQTLSSINLISSGDSFFDESSPKKIVRVKDNLENASLKFEFSLTSDDLSTEWVKNPVLDIQKYYKYKFDTSHFTLRGSHLDFSPSKNYNIITTESTRSTELPGNAGSYTTLKFGFGDAITNNTYSTKKTVYYTNFFYFDKNSLISSDNSYLNIIEDPLQGEKTISYTTPDNFVYDMTKIPEYDGSGSISYVTSSSSAIGEVNSIVVLNGGYGFSDLPDVSGIVPCEENECLVEVNWNNNLYKITSLIITNPGKNYINPKVVILSETGNGADFDISTNSDGSIAGIVTKDGGSNYFTKPIVKIVESSVKCYYESNNIGLPKSIRLTFNGKDYNNDITFARSYYGVTILKVKNIFNKFVDGETIHQYENNVVTAKAKVSKNGWKENTNIIRLENIEGIFKKNVPIIGSAKEGFAIVDSVFYTKFNDTVKSYYDNLGYYGSDSGKLSLANQKLHDNYFYQDFSYVIKSKSDINKWRELISETVHPAGFKFFGELSVESSAVGNLPSAQPSLNNISKIQLWDPNKNKITVDSSYRTVTTSIVSLTNTLTERGRGSVCQLSYDTGETNSYEFKLVPDFDGYFDANGNRNGTKTFTITLVSTNKPYAVPKSENIILSLDGIIQEPGEAFTVSNTQITFAEPPLGYRNIDGDSITKVNYKEGVDIPAQKIIGRIIRFKDASLNNTYFKKIKNISSQFDGVRTSFPLYYENNDFVNLPSKENLFIYLDGVLQESGITPTIPYNKSYYIRRTVVPNEIIFLEPPTSGQNFGGVSVGAYERLTLDYSYVDDIKYGPFPIKSLFFERRISIDDDKNILVLIDGVLQRRRKDYTILNSTIKFNNAIRKEQTVEIVYLYGREISKSILAFNTEVQPFLNRYNIIIDGDFSYVDDRFRAKSSTTEGIVRRVTYIHDMSGNVTKTILTVESQNTPFSSSENITFTYDTNTITLLASDIDYVVPFKTNDDSQNIVDLSRSSKLEKTEVPYRYRNSINPGDFIKIDGENDYRQVISIPDQGIKTDYRSNDDVNSSYYSKYSVTDYNYSQRGEGLEVIPTINNGEVVSLYWNKTDWEKYIGTSPTPPGYGYDNFVYLEFVAQPLRDESGEIIAEAQGGGAKAYVVTQGGVVVDVVLYDQGSGYVTEPKVYVTRGYEILRKRKSINTYQLNLTLTPTILSSSTFSISTITDIIRPLDLQIVSVLSSNSSGIVEVSKLSTVGINKIVSVDDVTTVTSVASTINLETSISSYNTIYTLSKYRTINLLRSVNITSSSRYVQNTTVVGAVDLLRLGIEGKYTQNVLGNRLKSFVDGFKSMDVGYANVSYISIGEYSSILPNVTLEDIDGELNTNYLENSYPWNLTYPSIQEHGAILDQNITASSTTVYIPDTSRFPNSGTLLIGDEIVTYTGKLSDRFIGVARGQAGTTAKLHQAGDYMRSLINDKITSWSWNGSGTLFNFSEAGVFWNDQP